jgi:hypothetical protein
MFTFVLVVYDTYVIVYSTMFKELDSKRMRALKRAQDERELALTKDKDMEKLHSEINDLETKREELLLRIGKYVQHSTYLVKVTDSTSMCTIIGYCFYRLLKLLKNFKKYAN